MYGILAVDRQHMLRQAVSGGVLMSRAPAVPMSAEMIFATYRGFDGLAWPASLPPVFKTESGLAATSVMASARSYADQLVDCDLIILADLTTNADFSGLGLLGFDVGYFESEWSHFSSILNEVLFGSEAEMRAYAKRLNSSLLFASGSDAADMLLTREQLLCRGADLEGGDLQTIRIYAPGR